MIIHHPEHTIKGSLNITGSKSETNRALILEALSKGKVEIKNHSNSDDSIVLDKALNSKDSIIDIGHAGTAMRFLTAYYALNTKKEIVLTGSERMQQRPINPLVDALNSMGAKITYTHKIGYPPLLIQPSELTQNKVAIPANVSSQYLSALLLIAPFMEDGLRLELVGELTSRPYLEMTLELLSRIGISHLWEGNTIEIKAQKINNTTLVIESDWSSASYFYSLIAIGGGEIKLNYYKQNSLQGDADLQQIYKAFGVVSIFKDQSLILSKEENFDLPEMVNFDLNHTPDIAQTIAVTCAALKIKCVLTGLATLKIKETDRLVALKEELKQFGVRVDITEDSLEIKTFLEPSKENKIVKTYHDHRMAMCFAPLSLKQAMYIEDPMVVTKSYPDFWEDLKKVIVRNKEINS